MRKILLLPLLGILFIGCMKEKTKLAKLQEKYDSLALAYVSQSIDLKNCEERKPPKLWDNKLKIGLHGYGDGEQPPFVLRQRSEPASTEDETTHNYNLFPRNSINGKMEIPYPGLTK